MSDKSHPSLENMEACVAAGPLHVGIGGQAFNAPHIDYWKNRALSAENALTETTGQLNRWVSYANKLERVLDVVARASTDELKKLQAEHAVESWRPPLTVVPKSAAAVPTEGLSLTNGGAIKSWELLSGTT